MLEHWSNSVAPGIRHELAVKAAISPAGLDRASPPSPGPNLMAMLRRWALVANAVRWQ
jgi:hypothetical protein